MSLACIFKSTLSLKNAKGFNRINRFPQAQSNQSYANQAIYIYLKGQVTIIQSINDKIEKIFADIQQKALQSSSQGNNVVGPTQSDIENIIFLQNVQSISNELLSCKYMDFMKVINQSISSLQSLLNNQRLVNFDKMKRKQDIQITDKNDDTEQKNEQTQKNIYASDNKITDEEKIAQQLLTTVLSINMYFNTVRIEAEREQINSSFEKTNNFSEESNISKNIEKENQDTKNNTNKIKEDSNNPQINTEKNPDLNKTISSNSQIEEASNSPLVNQQKNSTPAQNVSDHSEKKNDTNSPIANNSSNQDTNQYNNDENDDSDSDDDNDDDFVVCRICDEKVPIDEIDKHTNHCVRLYNSASFVAETDEKIRRLRDEISQKYLNENWPGEKDKATSIYIPVLNATLIIEQVLAINLNDADAIEQLTSYATTFDTNYIKAYSKAKSPKHTVSFLQNDTSKNPYVNFDNSSNSDIPLEILNRFKPLIDQKLKASRAVKFHSDELHSKSLRLTKQANISDFTILKRISSGAFARVFLARKNKTGDIYAIKVIPRSSLTEKNQVKRIMAEKDILLRFSNPYIVSFYYSIIGVHNLYLVMEYLPGGDLYSLLQHLGSLDEDTAKVYTYQIVHALKYLRENGIIHRDLKPDNILISKNGVLKLTDFGLSFLGMVNRRVSNGPNSFPSNSSDVKSNDTTIVTSNSYVGTPDYIAPEILMNKPHSFAVDLWSLGVIIYEFLMGEPPFHGDTEKETHERILRGRYYIDDEDMSPESIDLISRLLKLNPDDRIGSKDINEILNHPWLQGVNSAKAPFKPELNSKEDTNYFECRYELNEQDDKDILSDMEYAANSAEQTNNSSINSSSSGFLNNNNESPANSSVGPASENNSGSIFNNNLNIVTNISNLDSVNSSPGSSPVQHQNLIFEGNLNFRRSNRCISSSNSAPSKNLRQFLILDDSPIADNPANIENPPVSPSEVFNTPCEIKTSESFNENYQVVNSPTVVHRLKNNNSSSSSTSTLPAYSLSCETSTDDDSLASFPSLLSPQVNQNTQNQTPTKNVSISAPGSLRNLVALNKNIQGNNRLGIKFESVSVNSLAKENMRVANKVRRRRSISYSSNKINDINQRRNSDATSTKKYISLSNASNCSENDIEIECPIKGSILTNLTPQNVSFNQTNAADITPSSGNNDINQGNDASNHSNI